MTNEKSLGADAAAADAAAGSIAPDQLSHVAFHGRSYSGAVERVIAAAHPSPEDGGPCHGCAFRKGTEANRSDVTQLMIRMCVEGYRTFDCHMNPGLCKGYIAAANLRGVPASPSRERG